MAEKHKKNKTDDSLLDIDQYSMIIVEGNSEQRGTPHTARLASVAPKQTQSRKVPQKENTAVPPIKEIIDGLIMQDIAVNAKVFSQELPRQNRTTRKADTAHIRNQMSQARTSRPTRSSAQPSDYVVDLRKQYLIEKYNLNTLDKPRESRLKNFFHTFTPSRISRTAWHIPKMGVRIQPRRAPLAIEQQALPEEPIEEVERYVSSEQTRYGLAFASFLLILLFVLAPIPVVRYYHGALESKSSLLSQTTLGFKNLLAGISALAQNQYADASLNLQNARKNFADISHELNDFNTEFEQVIAVLPPVGSKLRLASNLATIGQNAADISALLNEKLHGPTDDVSSADIILKIKNRFAAIAESLKESKKDVQNLNISSFSPDTQTKVGFIQTNIDSIIASLETIDKVLTVSYSITGGEKPARYLFIFQNNRELRPTGGFIGSYALIDFSEGSVKNIEFSAQGTYAVSGGSKDHLIPPQPLTILNQEWFMWDANWWPDFPTSAKKIAWFYEHAGGPSVDGVIAVNSDLMPDLLKIVGPLSMPAYGVTITDSNFYSVIQKEVETDYDRELNQPKKILKDLIPVLFERLAQAQYQQLLTTLTQSLQTRDIQIAVFNKPDLTRTVEELGWSGTMKNSEKDFLSVISTNIAGGKSDGSVFETIDHHATIRDSGDVIVTTSVTKENKADPQDPFAYLNNVDYMRVYVPLGSTLIDAYGFSIPDQKLFKSPDASQVADTFLQEISGPSVIDQRTKTVINNEFGHTVFGNWIQTEPGTKSTISFTYKLPFRLTLSAGTGVRWLNAWNPEFKEVDGYSLFVQHQSGKKNSILNSTVTVSPRFTVVWADAVDPGSLGIDQSLVTYGSRLNTDTQYALLAAFAAPQN